MMLRACCVVVALYLAGCATPPVPAAPADTILTNGRIYTVDPAQPWAQAVAIKDGRYLYVGDAAGSRIHAGAGTRLIDLQGRMLMPGINDAHSHPWQGGVQALYGCDFPFTSTPEDIAARLRQCLASNPAAEWISGGQWTSNFFSDHDIGSPRAWLDAISTGQAIILSDDATHNAWVNSKALALAEIDRHTPDPPGGTILRDASGEPTGILLEAAQWLVLNRKPDWTVAEYADAILEALRLGNSFGITGLNEARIREPIYQAYQQLDQQGKLTSYITANQQTPREVRAYPLQISGHLDTRAQYNSRHVQTGFIKMFLDGVPTASRTALMLAPYTVNAEFPQRTHGELLVDAEILKQDLVALDKAGFTVKMHAAGDAAVRVALDAVQAARQANGASGLRHEIAHAGFIDPGDVPRFAELEVSADLSPYLWYPSPIIDSIVSALGERGEHYFPIRDLLAAGASVLAGSDWPSAAENLSPWHAIEAMVTRRNPFHNSSATLWAEQAISLQQALRIFTLDGARAMRLQQTTGSVVTGKSADFIVLDQSLFDIPVNRVSDTRVLSTWFEGKPVFGDL